jgi:hypothetical protein
LNVRKKVEKPLNVERCKKAIEGYGLKRALKARRSKAQGAGRAAAGALG